MLASQQSDEPVAAADVVAAVVEVVAGDSSSFWGTFSLAALVCFCSELLGYVHGACLFDLKCAHKSHT